MTLTVERDIFDLLMFLAPGLVAVGILRSLIFYPSPRVFDQIAQALIYTIIVHIACWGIIDGFETGTGEGIIAWATPYPPQITFPLAVLLAIFLAVTYGMDIFHRLLRPLGITRQTSFPSEWYSAFHQLRKCYVVLHLSEQRRVYGWPEEWPNQPDSGHFRLSKYAWLTANEIDEAVDSTCPREEQSRKFPDPESILIPAPNVDMVEFMRAIPEKENERCWLISRIVCTRR